MLKKFDDKECSILIKFIASILQYLVKKHLLLIIVCSIFPSNTLILFRYNNTIFYFTILYMLAIKINLLFYLKGMMSETEVRC